MKIPTFRLKAAYVTSVTERKPIALVLESGEVMHGTSLGSIDHPEFTKVRERLGQEGFILIERGWWNGDRTLKPFKLNGLDFKPGDKFPCASALSIQLSLKKRKTRSRK